MIVDQTIAGRIINADGCTASDIQIIDAVNPKVTHHPNANRIQSLERRNTVSGTSNIPVARRVIPARNANPSESTKATFIINPVPIIHPKDRVTSKTGRLHAITAIKNSPVDPWMLYI